MVGALHELEKLMEGVDQRFAAQAARGLDIDHGDEVLVLGLTLVAEVAQLLHLGARGTVEVVRPHLQAVLLRQRDVLGVALVDVGAALGSLEVDVGHLAIVADGLPEHFALVVAHVQAVDVVASVLTLDGVLAVHHGG